MTKKVDAKTHENAVVWRLKTSMPSKTREIPKRFYNSAPSSGIIKSNKVQILPDTFFESFNKVRTAYHKERKKMIPFDGGALVHPDSDDPKRVQSLGLDLVEDWWREVERLAPLVDEAAKVRKAELMAVIQEMEWGPDNAAQWERFVNKVVPTRGQFEKQWQAESILELRTGATSDDPDLVQAFRRGLVHVYTEGVHAILTHVAEVASSRIDLIQDAKAAKRPMRKDSLRTLQDLLDYLTANEWIDSSIASLRERLASRVRPFLNTDSVSGRKLAELEKVLQPVADLFQMLSRKSLDQPIYPIEIHQHDALPDENPGLEGASTEVRERYMGEIGKILNDTLDEDPVSEEAEDEPEVVEDQGDLFDIIDWDDEAEDDDDEVQS